MRRPVLRPVSLAVLSGLLLAWLAFGYYTWEATVVHPEPVENGPPKIGMEGRLRVETCGTATRTAIAYFSLVNRSGKRLRLIDTTSLMPLYRISLRARASGAQDKNGEAWTDCKSVGLGSGLRIDNTTSGLVELMPGVALTREFQLGLLFNLKASAEYQLTITYQPGALAPEMGNDFLVLDVYRYAVSATTTFDLDRAPR